MLVSQHWGGLCNIPQAWLSSYTSFFNDIIGFFNTHTWQSQGSCTFFVDLFFGCWHVHYSHTTTTRFLHFIFVLLFFFLLLLVCSLITHMSTSTNFYELLHFEWQILFNFSFFGNLTSQSLNITSCNQERPSHFQHNTFIMFLALH